MKYTIEEIEKAYNKLTEEEKRMMHADGMVSKYSPSCPVYGEEIYSGGGLCCPLMDFWNNFENEEEFWEEYDEIKIIIANKYLEKIEKKIKTLTYEQIKTKTKQIESWIITSNRDSMHLLLKYAEESFSNYKKMLDYFEMAQINFRETELKWLQKIHKMLTNELYNEWFNDFVESGYLNQTFLITPVYKGLKAIDYDITYNELRENWKCYQKILKHMVKDKDKYNFSKACRSKIIREDDYPFYNL